MSGWRLFWLLATLATAAFVAMFVAFGPEEAGLRALVRQTARISFALFLLAYCAAPLRRLWPTSVSRWMLRNRRYLGVSFAWAHGLHALAIGMLAILLGDAFETSPATLVGGGTAYALIAGMAITSTDRTARWLSPRNWGRLHRAGLHAAWLVFAVSWSSRLGTSGLYLALSITTFAAALLRAAAFRSRSASPAVVATATP